jgi:FkbM family methyltransferase
MPGNACAERRMAWWHVNPASSAGSARVALLPEPAAFGSFAPSPGQRRLLSISQNAPRNLFGKQLALIARALYLRGTRLPSDLTVDGIKLRCHLRDNTGERKFVFTPWRFDPRERGLLAEALGPDGVFIDIGANVGIYTLTAALRLSARGRIVAFEPYPPALQRLHFNIAATRAARADWPRIDVLDVGVSDREETRTLRIDSGNLGGGTLMGGEARLSRAGSRAEVAVRCRPLLDVLRELDITRIDVLKIDIEGAEDLALQPFLQSAIDAQLPRRMIIENSAQLWTRDLAGSLRARGYCAILRTRLNTVYSR